MCKRTFTTNRSLERSSILLSWFVNLLKPVTATRQNSIKSPLSFPRPFYPSPFCYSCPSHPVMIARSSVTSRRKWKWILLSKCRKFSFGLTNAFMSHFAWSFVLSYKSDYSSVGSYWKWSMCHRSLSIGHTYLKMLFFAPSLSFVVFRDMSSPSHTSLLNIARCHHALMVAVMSVS